MYRNKTRQVMVGNVPVGGDACGQNCRNCRGNENRSGNLPGRPRRRTGWNRGDGRNHFGPVNGSSVAHRSPVYLGGVVMTDGSGAA